MNMYLSHVSGVQKKALNPLAYETLWIVGSDQWVLGTDLRSSARAINGLKN